MLEFETLRAANLARQKEWNKGTKKTLTSKTNELAGEVGECCNVTKKIEREEQGLVGSRATIQDLADELADVIICADLVAAHTGINLFKAVVEKFNKTSEKYYLDTRIDIPQ